MKYAILLSALSISFVAAYFSIIGLTAMFPAAFWSIVIMGSVLEVAKLVSASWLHHNWKICPRSLKIYLTTAVVVLIFITSMGIFGYLSKSYITHQTVAEETKIILFQLDDKIQRENDYIQRQNEYLKDLDKQKDTSTTNIVYNIELEQKKIDDLYSSLDKSLKIDNNEITRLNSRLESLDEETALLNSKSGGLFSSKKKKLEDLVIKQKPERDEIKSKFSSIESRINKAREETDFQVKSIRSKIDERQNDTGSKQDLSLKKEEYNQNIQDSYAKIEIMEAEKFTHKNSQLEIEAEVGPVKYIAELLEDLGAQSIALAEAIRIIIMILIFVFDPLAVVMLLAANMSFKLASAKPYDKLSEQIKKKKIAKRSAVVSQEINSSNKEAQPAKKEFKENLEPQDQMDITEIKVLK